MINLEPYNAATVHRSSRLANKSPPPFIADWPADKMMTNLYSHNIQAPLGPGKTLSILLGKPTQKRPLLLRLKLHSVPVKPLPNIGKQWQCFHSINPPVVKEKDIEIQKHRNARVYRGSCAARIQTSLTSLDVKIQVLENQPSSSSSVSTPMAPAATAFLISTTGPADLIPSTCLAIISDLAVTYSGTLFYKYHHSFSPKPLMYIQRFQPNTGLICGRLGFKK